MAEITITLQPRTLRALLILACRDGISAEEILAGYAGDLTGTDRHGSDEEDMARDYYGRCDYAAELTFASYLIDEGGEDTGELEDACGQWDEIEEIQELLETETDPKTREGLLEELRWRQEELGDYYAGYLDYARRARQDPEPLEEAMQRARALLQELQELERQQRKEDKARHDEQTETPLQVPHRAQ